MATILLVDAQESAPKGALKSVQMSAQTSAGDAAVLGSALRVEGFDVVRAASAAEARKILDEAPVELVILDLMLRTDEGQSGLDFARELRRNHPSARVILTSSYYLSERQLERADCGVCGFIPKPYDVPDVVRFIQAKLKGPSSVRRLWHAEPITETVPRVSRFEAHVTNDVAEARSSRG